MTRLTESGSNAVCGIANVKRVLDPATIPRQVLDRVEESSDIVTIRRGQTGVFLAARYGRVCETLTIHCGNGFLFGFHEIYYIPLRYFLQIP